jgi:hypothetical protein
MEHERRHPRPKTTRGAWKHRSARVLHIVAPGSCRPRGLGSMRILLLVPFIGLLWVPFYNFAEPALFGFPFFYWYQFAWVPITSLLIWLVYRSRPHDDEAN